MPGPGTSTLTEGYQITSAEYARLARLVHSESGICLSDSKQALVLSRLSRRLRALGLTTFSDYLDVVERETGSEELGKMISCLTTNVTRFFREDHHFAELRSSVLPPLLDAARRGGRVRIWSAGCSTGEEPYSLAMTVLALCPEAPRLDVRILATDIDPEVLAVASRGTYAEQSLETVPSNLAERHFVREGEGRRTAGADLKSLISFRQLNLLREWPFKGPFDAVFCRNVVIYFDAETRERLWQRFAGVIRAGGRLFIGHSERISPGAATLFTSTGVTSYARSETQSTLSSKLAARA